MQQREAGVLQTSKKFLRHEAIDLYSSIVVATLKCTPKNARQMHSALQFYADNIEYLKEKFMVESEAMLLAFATEETTYERN